LVEKVRDEEVPMASTKQVQAAKRNVRKAISAAKSQRTITKLPQAVRQDLSRQAAKARSRGGRPGHAYEDRTRQELYEVAKRKGIPGRSKMGKWDLIDAIRKAG
jgi:Rho termination factor, N-terminal domain